jgi:hypothetical protein
MTRKEKVLNLFEFLMDLIDESPTTSKEVNDSENEVGRIIHEANFDGESIKRMQELIKYTNEYDKKKGEELGVQRIVQQTIKPILEQLKENGVNEQKKEFADRTGVTFDKKTGKLVEVDVPNKLRDGVPTDEEEDTADSTTNESTSIPTDTAIKRPTIQISEDIKK